MNKPFLCVVIVLLWIMSLVAYLVSKRYQIHYNNGEGVVLVLDKWNGVVQTVHANKQYTTAVYPAKVYPKENGAEKSMNLRAQKITSEVIVGIQNKEP